MRLPLIVLMAVVATPAGAVPSIAGRWTNPARSVEISMAPCGSRLCGTIVAADTKATADAAAGGTERLVGTQLFRGLVADGPGHWSGEVFVPDLGRTVAGTLTLVDAGTIEVEGCIVPGLVCQTQEWKRVDGRRRE